MLSHCGNNSYKEISGCESGGKIKLRDTKIEWFENLNKQCSVKIDEN